MMAAGCGSLVIMRSSIYKIRVADTDVGVGPAAILDTILLVADRGIDRRAAIARAHDVNQLIAQANGRGSALDPHTAAKILTQFCLALMQNVDDTTSKSIVDSVNATLKNDDIAENIKLDIVVLKLGMVVGPEVLTEAIISLGERIRSPIVPMPPPGSADDDHGEEYDPGPGELSDEISEYRSQQ